MASPMQRDGTIVQLPRRSEIAGQEGARVNELGVGLPPNPLQELFDSADITIEAADGVSVAIGDDLPMPAVHTPKDETPFDENLVGSMFDPEDRRLGEIASDVIQGVDMDELSRTEWINQYNKGIDLLGLKVEDMAATGSRRKTSRAGHPLMIEAMVKYEALALDTPIP